MTPEEFRIAGREVVDWIADYRQALEGLPVGATTEPGSVRRALVDAPSPLGGGEVADFLALLDDLVVPNQTVVQHPSYFGWFPANASLASVLGDLASSGLGQLGISWESSPALTEVEEAVCRWMGDAVGLDDGWTGSLTDTASTGTFTALVIARERATGLAELRGGLASHPEPLTVATTEQAHSSVRKGALVAGFGADHLHDVPTDDAHRMDPAALAECLAADRAAGRRPAAVVASCGSTGVTAFDPIDAIADVLDADHAAHPDQPRVWLHVDAAMAGTAMVCPEFRPLWAGVERADSVGWNPHKWMGTVLDCSLLYVRDVAEVEQVLSTNPAYLRSSADGAVTQLRDRGVPLGRRFRSLKLWAQLHLDGLDSVAARVRRDVANARRLADEVAATPGWELMAPVPLQTVVVRHVPDGADDAAVDRHTQTWAAALNRSGRAFVTPSVLDGRWVVRVSVGAETTEWHHVEGAWAAMRELAEG